MRLYKSLEEVLQDIKIDDRNKLDFSVRGKDLTFRSNGTIVRAGRESLPGLHVSDYAMTQLLNRYDLPVKDSKKLYYTDPEGFTVILNNYMKSDDREILIRSRVERNKGIVRSILSDNYSIINNNDIMDVVNDMLKGNEDIKVSNFFLNDRIMHLRLVFIQTEERIINEDLKVDDTIMNGIDIVNSEVGRSSLRLEPMVFRLVCANGLKAWRQDGENGVRLRHIHIDQDELYKLINEGVEKGLNTANKINNRYKESRKMILANPVKEIYKIAEEEKLSKKMTDRIVKAYEIEPERNKYGVINAFTRAARDLEGDRKLEMEKLAGKILAA